MVSNQYVLLARAELALVKAARPCVVELERDAHLCNWLEGHLE